LCAGRWNARRGFPETDGEDEVDDEDGPDDAQDNPLQNPHRVMVASQHFPPEGNSCRLVWICTISSKTISTTPSITTELMLGNQATGLAASMRDWCDETTTHSTGHAANSGQFF
jgi:hypothetical protein